MGEIFYPLSSQKLEFQGRVQLTFPFIGFSSFWVIFIVFSWEFSICVETEHLLNLGSL